MTTGPAPGAGGNGPGRPPGAPEPLIRVGDDFEDEYPGASALATECYANLYRAAIRAASAPPIRDARRVRPDRTADKGT